MAGEDFYPDGASFPDFPWTLSKDGEPWNFDSLMKSGDPKRGLIGKLMQAVAYLRAKVDGYLSSTYHYPIGSRSTKRAQQSPMTNSVSGVTYGAGMAGCGPAEIVVQPLMFPHGSTLTSISARIAPFSHASLPVTVPYIRINRVNVDTGASSLVGAAPDASTDGASYSAAHLLTLSGLNEVVDRSTYYYYASITGEGGSGATAISCSPCKTTVTITAVDECY